MLEKIRVVFTIPELRNKILLTLFLLAVYRIGYWVPLPVIDQEKVAAISSEGTFGDILSKVAVLSASQLQQATIFGLGIMPYISASIIFQLLGTVWKPLEELRKEGEAGRKKDQRVHSVRDRSSLFTPKHSVCLALCDGPRTGGC